MPWKLIWYQLRKNPMNKQTGKFRQKLMKWKEFSLPWLTCADIFRLTKIDDTRRDEDKRNHTNIEEIHSFLAMVQAISRTSCAQLVFVIIFCAGHFSAVIWDSFTQNSDFKFLWKKFVKMMDNFQRNWTPTYIDILAILEVSQLKTLWGAPHILSFQ